MPKTSTKPVDAEKIAETADRGRDISAHFTNQFTVVRPAIQQGLDRIATRTRKTVETLED